MKGRSQGCTAPGCSDPSVGRRLCRKHYQQAWKSGELGQHEKQPTREYKPTACPPDHKHALSRTCYVQHQCRCDACRDENNNANKRRTRLKAYGRFDIGLVDVVPVREHMMMLAEYGLGYKRVAGLAGVGITAARTIIWGRQEPGPRHGELQKRVKRETAEKILAVKPDISALAGGAIIPARGVHRRMQALCTRGWSVSRVGAEIGMTPANMWKVMERDTVTVHTHRAVAAVFDKWWNVTPPQETRWQRTAYSRAVNFAKARRWLAPLAWDDIDNDPEPPMPEQLDGGVDDMAIALAVMGENVRLTHDERREAVRRLHAELWSDNRIAETLHIADRTVLRIRQELGLAAFDQNELRDRGCAA